MKVRKLRGCIVNWVTHSEVEVKNRNRLSLGSKTFVLTLQGNGMSTYPSLSLDKKNLELTYSVAVFTKSIYSEPLL